MLRILLVEDNPGDALEVREQLEDGLGDDVQLTHVTTMRAAVDHLDAHPETSLALVDMSLPDSDGLDSPRRMLAHAADVPVVVLTGAADEVLADQALALGAQDYVVKASTDATSLSRIIRYAVTRAAELRTLRRQLVALRQTNEELAQYAYKVAHDLKSPVVAVRGISHTLGAQNLSEDADLELREALLSVAARASQMIDELLSEAVSTGGTEDTDLRDIVEWVRQMLHAEILTASAELRMGELPTLRVNPTLVRQVVLNLVSNAIRYRAPERRLLIDVSARHQRPDWVVTVADNGLGIPHDKREEVFERGVGSETDGSTGLGLTSVREAIGRLGGSVWIEDSPMDDGVAVRFSLPARGA